MQLNFLQEDLLAVMQSDAPTTKTPSLPRTSETISKPVQTSWLPEPAPKPAKQAVSKVAATPAAEEKAPNAFKTISEAADQLGVPAHVLRFWESQFTQIAPTKSRGGRRYYRPDDMKILTTIKHLLYKQGYTIKGARKALSSMKDGVVDAVPVAAEKTAAVAKPVLSDKQRAQLSAIRSELLGLKQQLMPHLA